MDVAKRLLDLGFHAPTTYFPLLISECLLIEPTETESKQTLDAFVAAMAQILREAQQEPERLQRAPHTLPVRRLDDVRAARELDLTYKGEAADAAQKMQGLDRLLRAFGSSAKGFAGAFREEAAFRQELLFACVALPLALWLGRTRRRARAAGRAGAADPDRRAAQQRDRGHGGSHRLERHVLAGLAKDIGSAAVCCPSSCWAWSGCWCCGL
jgi:diacylglycerol kinase